MMKKLQLELETLKVESFDTSAPHAQRGTVVSAESELGSCNIYCTFDCGFTGGSMDNIVTCGCAPPSGFKPCFNPTNTVG
jgi:hypothetical protein